MLLNGRSSLVMAAVGAIIAWIAPYAAFALAAHYSLPKCLQAQGEQVYSPAEVQQWVRQVASGVSDFNPDRPTLLFFTNIPIGLSCGGLGINNVIELVRANHLDVNVLVVVECDIPGESKVIKGFFTTRNVVEDTSGRSIHLLGIGVLPSAALISPLGERLLLQPDVLHNPLQLETLLRYVEPAAIRIPAAAGHRLGEEHPFVELNVLKDRYGGAILLADPNQAVLLSLDTARLQLTPVFELHDSLRFSSEALHITRLMLKQEGDTAFFRLTEADLRAGWEFVEKYFPRPFAKLHKLLALQHDTLIAIATLTLPTRETFLTPQVLCTIAQIRTANPKLHFSPIPPVHEHDTAIAAFELFATADGQLAGVALTPTGGKVLRLHRKRWERLNDTLVPLLPTRYPNVYPSIYATPLGSGRIALVSPIFGGIVWLEQAATGFQLSPFVGYFERFATRWDSIAEQAYETARARLSTFDPPNAVDVPKIRFRLRWQCDSEGDTVALLAQSGELFALQMITPSGLKRALWLSPEPPQPLARVVAHNVVLFGGKLFLFLKWKPLGWYVYRLDLQKL